MEFIKAILYGIIQGITEWLPISSTGHMILFEEFAPLGLGDAFRSVFLVVIQLGSILAVVVLFFHKLNPFSPRKNKEERRETWSLWGKVLVAVIPAGIIGVVFNDEIDRLFFRPQVVAATLILYGVLFILLERRKRKPTIRSFHELGYREALLIGACQVLALVPGTSRSGATILGAVFLGSSRVVASEFSFFLAIPVMLGASLLKLAEAGGGFSTLEWSVLITGAVTAFIVSIFAIRFLLGFIKRNDFTAFGYYRIVLGLLVLLYFSLR